MRELRFDENGYLKPYDAVDASWKDIEEFFVFNDRRADLAIQLRGIVSRLAGFKSERLQIWIDGSFATLKAQPNDIDVVCFVDDTLYDVSLPLFESLKKRFSPNGSVFHKKLSCQTSKLLFN
jgi:hypothetical protein